MFNILHVAKQIYPFLCYVFLFQFSQLQQYLKQIFAQNECATINKPKDASIFSEFKTNIGRHDLPYPAPLHSIPWDPDEFDPPIYT
jgi:hypothetical protein